MTRGTTTTDPVSKAEPARALRWHREEIQTKKLAGGGLNAKRKPLLDRVAPNFALWRIKVPGGLI